MDPTDPLMKYGVLGCEKLFWGGTVSVKVNNQLGPYFVSHKGVRQGDPLYPILFNFVTDYLTRMIRQAQRNGLITGLADNIIQNGVAVLQFADDTIICLKDDFEIEYEIVVSV